MKMTYSEAKEFYETVQIHIAILVDALSGVATCLCPAAKARQ